MVEEERQSNHLPRKESSNRRARRFQEAISIEFFPEPFEVYGVDIDFTPFKISINQVFGATQDQS